jgi:uncharacterized protein
LRIIHLSDFHLRRRWWPEYDELIRRVSDDPPDLLLITGDFVDNKFDHRPTLPVLRRLLGGLCAAGRCYGVLGNHDGDLVGPLLGQLGVQLLDGRRTLCNFRGHDVELIGLPGPERGDITPRVLAGFPPRDVNTPRIVLSHYPDTINIGTALEADLFLTGHTHGGQVCLPSGRALITHDSLPKTTCKGVSRHGRTWLVINRGFGFAGIPLRLFCPAEVIELRLLPARDSRA